MKRQGECWAKENEIAFSPKETVADFDVALTGIQFQDVLTFQQGCNLLVCVFESHHP